MVQNAGNLLKNGQNKRRGRLEIVAIPYFLACFFARTVRKLESHCKIKSSDLSFCVDELACASADAFASWLVYLLTNP